MNHVGKVTGFMDEHPIKTDGEFADALQDCIRQRGAMTRLVSDHATAQTSKRTKDILRTLCIDEWQSEPHNQQQNPAEQRCGRAKAAADGVLNGSGVPAYCWPLALLCACYIMNRLACEALDWDSPYMRATRHQPIAPLPIL